MALRDQPYLPLYIKDFTTDEKLMECSAQSTGVYIRIMCVMHKSEPYGTILLKQKDKQSKEQIINFAAKLAKFLPFDLDTILAGLKELVGEGCLYIEGDMLFQKRMKKDGEISITRSNSGSLGGQKTKENLQNFAKAKIEANSANGNGIKDENGGLGEREEPPITPPPPQEPLPEMTQQDLVSFQGKLIQEVIFIEQLMMTKQIKSKTDMLGWIKYFNLHIIGEDKLNKDYPEYKRHFKNWIVKFDTTKPPPINGNANVIPITVTPVDDMMKKYQKK